jgi:hypothetical protein
LRSCHRHARTLAAQHASPTHRRSPLVAGDSQYGVALQPATPIPRLLLHAHSLELDHPEDSRRLRFATPLPPTYVDAMLPLGFEASVAALDRNATRVAPQSALQTSLGGGLFGGRNPRGWRSAIQAAVDAQQEEGIDEVQLPVDVDDKVRIWASDRAQVLSRTVRGVMLNSDALRVLARLESVAEEEVEALVASKFEFVLSCQAHADPMHDVLPRCLIQSEYRPDPSPPPAHHCPSAPLGSHHGPAMHRMPCTGPLTTCLLTRRCTTSSRRPLNARTSGRPSATVLRTTSASRTSKAPRLGARGLSSAFPHANLDRDPGLGPSPSPVPNTEPDPEPGP